MSTPGADALATGREQPIAARLRVAIVAVPAVAVAAGAAALAGDSRLALLSVAVVLGWTRLVGL
jgi:hypothetical protein